MHVKYVVDRRNKSEDKTANSSVTKVAGET
jgi:hypothetical protein